MDTRTQIASAPYASRIDLSRYDRTPTLTDEELRVARRWAQGTVIIRRQSPRLYAPLADVLLHDGLDRMNRLRSVKLVLTEVGRSGQAYWGWSKQQWLELIDRTPVPPTATVKPQLTALAYFLGGFRSFYDLRRNISLAPTARLVFGSEVFNSEAERLMAALVRVGFKCVTMRSFMPSIVAAVALEGGDPRLESFDTAVLERTRSLYKGRIGSRIVMLANGLAALGITNEEIRFRFYESRRGIEAGDVHPEWMRWCRRWLETTTLIEATRRATYNMLIRVGIWLGRTHPEVTGPEQWTVDICADYLAAVDKLTVGGWAGSAFDYRHVPTAGQPLKPGSKVAMHQAVRRFLADAHSWGWATPCCNPRYHLATPRSVLRLVKVNPRTIDDAVWLKLTWASLNLQEADLIQDGRYPLKMLKAMAVIWTHAGLRSNEIVRLRLDCVRPQEDDVTDQTGAVVPGGLDFAHSGRAELGMAHRHGA